MPGIAGREELSLLDVDGAAGVTAVYGVRDVRDLKLRVEPNYPPPVRGDGSSETNTLPDYAVTFWFAQQGSIYVFVILIFVIRTLIMIIVKVIFVIHILVTLIANKVII